jgi:flagellar basal body rod protein FlgC
VEMVDMIAATRAYQANVTAFESSKTIITSALRLIA